MTDKFDDFLEKLTQHILNFGFQLLLMFNIIKTHMDLNYNKLYTNNEVFHRFIDKLGENVYCMKQLSLSYYIEPPFSYFKICYKDKIYKEEYVNADTILYGTKTISTLSNLVSEYKSILSLMKPIIRNNELEYLVLLHYRNLTDDYIISRLIFNNDTDDECNILCDTVPTRNYFLSIEYNNPNMKTTISLNLDKRYLISGNELFSPCFVLKCLNYQNEPYVFDKNYKLTILDSGINGLTLNSNQYIRLTDSKYEVIELKSNIKND